MLWEPYVYRRGSDVYSLWDQLLDRRRSRLLYIAGRGFDTRSTGVMNAFVGNVLASGHVVDEAQLLLVGFSGYELSEELVVETERNARALEDAFRRLGSTSVVTMGSGDSDEEGVSASGALRAVTERVLDRVAGYTDIVLDVSTLPRVVYLALLTGILHRLVPDKTDRSNLLAGGVNFQVLVAEDAALDAAIRSEDPSNDLVTIPGFSSALHAESVQEWPLVWFPILGENRVSQLKKVMEAVIPSPAEICPVLPHPSRVPRRSDSLLAEYNSPLFRTREIPTSNIIYAHEAHPFEAYRQILQSMARHRDSLRLLGGCRLVVTPLGSKLITLGAGLACFEMRPDNMHADFGVAISHAEPKRYVVPVEALRASKPEMSSLLLTGEAYDANAAEG
jgi:hypothetical protein